MCLTSKVSAYYISKDVDASWRQELQCEKEMMQCIYNYQTLIDGIEMYMYKKTICDPLSKNLAHPAFYEMYIRLEIGI